MAAGEFTAGGLGPRDIIKFSLHFISGRWFTIFASVLILAVAGATYMYALYSGDIKSALGYDQTTVNLLGFFKDLGANVGVISGLINEVAPPWAVLLIGAAMNFSGYFMIWVAVAGHVAKPKVWQMCVYICIGANSQTFANTGALVTCVKNFPRSRGIVLGLLKGFVGLSGAIITQLYHSFYGHDSKSLILLIAWLPAVVSILFLRVIRIMKVEVDEDRHELELKIFYNLLYISLGLAGFLMIVIILQNRLVFSPLEYSVSATIVVILLFAPIALLLKEDLAVWNTQKLKPLSSSSNPQIKFLEIEQPAPLTNSSNSQIKIQTQNPLAIEPTPNPQIKIQTQNPSAIEPTPNPQIKIQTQNPPRLIPPRRNPNWVCNIFNPPERGEDYTILQALFSIDMAVLFLATTCGVGGTLTAIDNLGQIGKSLGYKPTSTATFVSLVSIWNYLGRVASGFASEILLTKYKFPRPLMLTLVMILSCLGHLLIAFGIPNSLYVASVIIGFCFGAQWPLLFAIISEIFGLKYYSTLYNLGGVASPVGSYLLNVMVAGHLYDKEGLKQMEAKGLTRRDGEDLICVGVDCYKVSFLIITAVTVFGCLVSFVLVVRTRSFYSGDVYRKFREAAAAMDVELQRGTTLAADGTSGNNTTTRNDSAPRSGRDK